MSMFKEIKFRVFDKANKKMLLSNASSSGDFWYPWGFQMRSKYNKNDSRPSDCEIMQFTGLKDKNGRDIYEGDILHIDYVQEKSGDHGGKYDYYGHREGQVIRHESGVYQLSDENGTRIWSFSQETRQVVGNVYENPEILEINHG